jgi:hypothetical protein
VHAAGVLNQEGLWGATKDTAPLAPRIDLPILFADHAGSPFRRKENWGTTRRTSVGRASECQFWGRTFETRSGVRQHERKAHFQEYAAALTTGVRPDPAEILTAQLHALAVAELEIGPHLGRLAVHLGWTIDMVKYRRRLTRPY